MTKVNKKFIGAMQKRLDEKEIEYGGEDNDRNWNNMTIDCLWYRLMEQTKLPDITLGKSLLVDKCFRGETKKKLADIANFCWMLWERLE